MENSSQAVRSQKESARSGWNYFAAQFHIADLVQCGGGGGKLHLARLFTCGEASRSISDAFLTLTLLTLLDKFLIRGHRAIISIKAIMPEVLDLTSDKCDHL